MEVFCFNGMNAKEKLLIIMLNTFAVICLPLT